MALDDPLWGVACPAAAGAVFNVRKNGVSALATSPGVWNRASGSFAIILATSAASSAGTSGRTRLRGVASIEWCAWRRS